MPPERWDVLVVGGGTAGMTAARAAAAEGARVVLVEREAALGGECTFTGCVPSKAMIEVAKLYRDAGRGERLGIRADGLRMDFPALMAHVQAVIADINRATRRRGRIPRRCDCPPDGRRWRPPGSSSN